MNNKQLLAVLFTTAFSGMIFATSPATVDMNSHTAAILLTEVQQTYCHAKNTAACEAISAFLSIQGVTIDTTSPELAALLHNLNEEINGKNNNTNLLEAALSTTEEITEEVHTALMVIPQEEK
ncbi:MAG TPA: hypothetical protein VKR54_00295 [Candidatus Babeliales bacterium]|jgi:hypothetical protein|nr:hypothetical protein [Candidatus Babeliales bacterium]